MLAGSVQRGQAGGLPSSNTRPYPLQTGYSRMSISSALHPVLKLAVRRHALQQHEQVKLQATAFSRRSLGRTEPGFELLLGHYQLAPAGVAAKFIQGNAKSVISSRL